jgi:hypothetical protein
MTQSEGLRTADRVSAPSRSIRYYTGRGPGAPRLALTLNPARTSFWRRNMGDRISKATVAGRGSAVACYVSGHRR